MRRPILSLLVALTLSLGLVGTVSAQEALDAPEADEIIIVDFETFDADDAVMDKFYGHLRNMIASEDSMSISSTGDVSMGDLWLMAGCNSPEPDCLGLLGDFVDGSQLLFGSVEQSDDVHMFTMKLFDFGRHEIIRSVSEQTLRGDEQWLDEGIPAVIEHLLYGNTASLQVTIEGASNAEIRINGEAVGTGDRTVEGVAPGEVVVTAVSQAGTQKEERLILRHQKESQVTFEFDPAIADIDRPGDGPSLVPGLAASGAGVVGVVVAVIGQSQLSSANSEAEALVGDRNAINSDELSHAQSLQSDMNRGNTMRIAGGTVGLLGLAGGGFLLFQALTADSAGDSPDLAATSSDFRLDVGASSEGFNAGIRFDF